VKRLAPSEHWDQQALLDARGLPWNQLAGAGGKQNKNDVKRAPMLESILEEPEDFDRIPVILARHGANTGAETKSEAGPDSPSEAPSPPLPAAAAAPLSVASSGMAAAPTPLVNPPPSSTGQEGTRQEGTTDDTSAMDDAERGDKRKGNEPTETLNAMTMNSIEDGPADPCFNICAAIEGAARFYATNHRSDLRWQELTKLQQLGYFEVIPKSLIGQTKILTTTWVDSDSKSRLGNS
jgi:hypothetical protein